jgi:hypothetical protein
MSTVGIDAATRERFLAAGEVVEVRDESGAVFGQFYRGEIDRWLTEEGCYAAREVRAFLAGMRRAMQ